MIQLILIEDDANIQQALSFYFSSQEEFVLLASYKDGTEYRSKMINEQPDVAIVDINLPGESGIDLIPQIKKDYPNVSILMLSVNNDNESVFRSLQNGADGYLGKETPLDKIKEAILDLSKGGSPITPAIARKVFDFFNSRTTLTEGLNDREVQVVNGIVEGLSYKLVADRMGVSIDTVRKYIKSIYRKLHINSKGELIAKFHQH